jgi:hypothetical protein
MCFGIVTAGYMDKALRDFLVARDGAIADVIDHTPRAASAFIDPTGEIISEVLQDEEGIAYDEIDLNRSEDAAEPATLVCGIRCSTGDTPLSARTTRYFAPFFRCCRTPR